MKIPKVTLYCYDSAPMAQPVRIMLLEKRIDHDRVIVNGHDKPDWFIPLSPNGTGQIPILKVDENILFESTVIIEYLDEVFGDSRMMPDDPTLRALNRAWMLQSLDMLIGQAAIMGARRKEDFEHARTNMLRKLELLAAAKSNGPYFNGDRFSLVDIQFAPILIRLDILDRIHKTNILSHNRKIAEWTELLAARPSVQETLPRGPDGESFDERYVCIFMDSYLTAELSGGLRLPSRRE